MLWHNSTFCIWELEIGKFAISFSYLPRHRRMHPERGFFGRFGFYWGQDRIWPPLKWELR